MSATRTSTEGWQVSRTAYGVVKALTSSADDQPFDSPACLVLAVVDTQCQGNQKLNWEHDKKAMICVANLNCSHQIRTRKELECSREVSIVYDMVDYRR